MKIVVISHNQESYLPLMEDKLSSYDHIIVVDRPSVQFQLTPNMIVNTKGKGFLAGKMRDIGAAEFGNDDILFLDGDKIPLGDIPNIDSTKYDCVIFPCEEQEDIRKSVFKDEFGIIEPDTNPISNFANVFYTCGIFYSKRLIKRFRELNEGRIFHPAFDGHWGEEDRWNGDIINFEQFNAAYSQQMKLSGTLGYCHLDTVHKEQGSGNTLEDFSINMYTRVNLRRTHYGVEI